MPTTRRRPEQEFEATGPQLGTQTLTLSSLTGGRNGYTNPELLSPQFWTSATLNVYSGLHGTIRRARWAPVFNSTATNYSANGFRILSMTAFQDIPNAVTWLMFDNNDSIATTGPRWMTRFPLQAWSWTGGPSFQAQVVLNIWTVFSNNFVSAGPQQFPLSLSLFNGPYSRQIINNIIVEANGLLRTKVLIGVSSFYGASFNNTPLLEFWGIDAPDVSPSISLSAGSTATLLASPNGASRMSNVVTFTATGALPANLVVGAFVNVSGVTDTSFNSAAGTAFLVTSVSSPSFTVNQIGPNTTSGSGTVTVQITKTVGRSYQYAWENVNTGHVSAPSPASQYIAYNNQTGTIDLVEPGTITTSGTTATGTNTFFSSAWVGKHIWLESTNPPASGKIYVTAVAGPTTMTLSAAPAGGATNARFQIYDPQVTHVRLYATGDGGAVYLRIARNRVQDLGNTSITSTGLRFTDTANSEPPNAPFTNELAQNNNVPPPIGSFLEQYQARILVYGVPGALQSFFYTNIETTVVGQPPESSAPLNEVTLPIGDGQLYGSANLPTGLILWSNRQDMFKLTGTLTDNMVAAAQQLGASIQRLPYKIGSASPYATTVTSLGAFWFSSDREVWLFTDHYAPKNIGKPIQDLLNKATRISFARMKNYKAGDRNWLALAITTKGGSFNDTLCLLDLDLLASNGQPSFFTFDMATNQPSWYVYNTNCESIEAAFDANSTNHLLVGDIDLITDVDWTDGYYTVSAEQSVASSQLTLHALGNQDPEIIKTGRWMRVTTNQLPKVLASQGWNWNVLCYDDDKYVLGTNPQTVKLVPGVDSPNQVFGLEYSPSVFRFGGLKPVKGRRFQIQCNFPSGPGFYELRGYQVSYDQIVAR